MNTLILIVTALAVGAASYFGFLAVYLRRQYNRGMTAIEKAQAEREEFQRREQLGATYDERLRNELRRRGYTGEPLPVVVGGALVYLLIIAIGRGLDIPVVVSVLAAVPASIAAALFGLRNLNTRRNRLFNRQFVSALSLLAAQLETGAGLPRAIENVTPSLDEPLRSEFMAVSAAGAATDITVPLEELRKKYPSRALDMTVSAVRLSATTGGSLAPVLREAANLLRDEFALAEEAVAEISQVRGEFFLIVGIILFIVLSIVSGADSEMRDGLFSPVGIIFLTIGAANFAWGIKRALSYFSDAKGGRV